MLMEPDRLSPAAARGTGGLEHLGDLILKPPRGEPGGEAFVFLNGQGEIEATVRHGELRERMTRAAAAIQAFTKPGEVVVLAGLEGLDFLEAFFGCILAGAIPAPLPRPRHPRDQSGLNRLRGAVSTTRAAAVITDAGTCGLLQGNNGTPVPARLPEDLRGGQSEDWIPVAMDPEQTAYLQFTSGSTAEPRGVILTHRNVLAGLEYMHRAFAHRETLRVAGWLPLHHDMGLAGHVLLPLYEGGSAVLMAPSTFLRQPALWLKAFQRFGANACAAPPFALEWCLRKRLADDPALDLSNWKYAYIGSEVVRAAVLDRFAEAFAGRGLRRDTLRPCYGLAEATLFVAGAEPHQAGKPPAYAVDPDFVGVRIVQPLTGALQPDGEPGEVWISGAPVSSRHWTADGVAVSTSPLPGSGAQWAPTGDWGSMADGKLSLAGRTKDLVIIRGTKLASEELEQTVRACGHPALAPGDATACFAMEQAQGEAFVVVQETPRHLSPAVQEELKATITAALLDAHDAHPAAVLLVPAGTLPRTVNGKISRPECRRLYGTGEFAGIGFPARSPRPRKVREEKNPTGEDPVAIIGLACRFPGAPDVEAFWKLLAEGGDAISEVPPDRWDHRLFHDDRAAVPGRMNSKWGGFVPGIDQFDPAFFGISAKEAVELDPQHRLLLETAWRLFEHAGLKLEAVEKSETGVFVGISTNDYLYTKIKLSPGMETFDAYSGLGNANSIAANRLSYLFDLRGPSITVDTACSSSLTAFHLAVESVLKGDCAMAIAGGANAILSPGPSITLSQFGMLAPDGRCKAFDARADGYVRAEGCGLVLLKRLSAARRDGDPVLATVRASVIGQDGRTLGITSPNGGAQRELLKKAVGKAGIHPAEVGHVEAHGTGTAAGDPVEVAQIKAIYGTGDAATPCYLGSVKANIGHLEAAAGIAGVIKTVLMLQHRAVPPQIHVRSLNPLIDLTGSRLRIPSRLTPWPADGAARMGVVSSFGFGGANAHAVLEEAPPEPGRFSQREKEEDGPLTFQLSCKSREALRLSAREWRAWLTEHPHASLKAVCAGQASTRTVFPVRESWPVSSREELLARLDFLTGTRESAPDTAAAVASPAAESSSQETSGQNGQETGSPVRLNLPGHPFSRRRYWIANATAEDFGRLAGPPAFSLPLPAPDAAPTPAPAAVPAVPTAEMPAAVPEPQPQPRQAPGAASWNYAVEWVSRPFERERRSPAGRPASEETNWILVGEGAGLARGLVEELKAAQQPVFWIGPRPMGVPGVRGYPAPEGCTEEAYGEILRHILTMASREGAKNWRILHLAGLDSRRMHDTTAASLEQDQDRHGTGDVLRLTRAVTDTGRILQMWLVTSFAQSVQGPEWRDADGAIQVTQAPLWGLARTLFLEHPELRGGVLDIDPTDARTAAGQILWQAADPEGEHAVAFRGGRRYIAQLAPLPVPEAPVPARFRSDGVFVITGGLGGLGLRSAQWLVRHGARDVVLLGRRGLPSPADREALPAEDALRHAAEAVAAMEQQGAKVETAALDVRDAAGLHGLFARLREDGRPIRGVIHAAGVNWFGKIRQLDPAEALETMRIKVSAAWTLHELTSGEDLDCFLLFSSVSALWGSVELSHYTAANHFLDALSSHRAARNLPSLSINWGPWAEAGMSAKAHETEILPKLGLRLMPPEQALEAMLPFGPGRHPVRVIADIDWQRFRMLVEFSLSPSLFERVTPAPARRTPRSGAAEPGGTSLETVDPLAALEEIIRRALGSVMMLETSGPVELDQRFNLVGMDSLMSIAFAAELERALNLQLPNTLAYNYPTLRAVRDHLYTLLQAEQRVPASGAPPAPAVPGATAEAPPVEKPAVSPDWFLFPPSKAETARPRIFCFPCAGAGASLYTPWIAAAAAWAEVVPVQYPGREELADLPPLRSLTELASALADRLPEESAPFAFYGYSLGALAAFALARELRRRGRAVPAHLFLAGCGLPAAAENRSFHRLDDESFLEAVAGHLSLDSRPETRDIARTLLPVLRADIEMLESFHPLPEEPPLACPVSILTGAEDPVTPRESVMRWHEMTTGDFHLRRFPGRHDFHRNQQTPILAALRGLFIPEPPSIP